MPPRKKVKAVDTHLVWTDLEIQMLLVKTRDLKVGKACKGVDREIVKEKHQKIREKFTSRR